LKPRDIRELVLTLAATTLDFMVGLVAAAAAGAVEVGAWLATAPAVAEARRLTPARASLVSLGGLDGSREVVGGIVRRPPDHGGRGVGAKGRDGQGC
jgi:hypothetical protein